MEPESDVMAARILRGLEISPALMERQWLKQPRTHKTRSDRLISIDHLRKICPNVLQQITDRIARRQLGGGLKIAQNQLTLSSALW